MGGTIQWVFHNGQRLTPWMLYILGLIDAEMFRLFGVHVLVSSGIRTYEEQRAIFLARYVTAGNINGNRVYDTRWWEGRIWYRISSAGTVAQPGTSNHEVQGERGAWDLRDTGNDAGVTVASSARGRWIRQNAGRFGIVASGDGFGEGWHFDVLGIFRTPPSSGGGTVITEEEDEDMSIAVRLNKKHLFHMGFGKIKHLNNDTPIKGNHNVGPATLTMRIVQPDDKWIEMNTAEFQAQLDSFHIPRSVVDVNTGYVLDVSKPEQNGIGGQRVSGGAWDWARAAYQNTLNPTKPLPRY